MAGPFFVIVASLASAWMAVRSDDGVVADDYYKQGLSINRRLQRADVDPGRQLGATITVTTLGEVRVLMEGLVDAPKELRLKLKRPAATRDEIVILRPGPDGEYVGMLSEQTPGRWIVTLESSTWRLPTTTITGRLSRIRLGTADRHRSPDVGGLD